MDQTLIAVLVIVGGILSNTISFVLGLRAERRKQSAAARAAMLEPIREWLGGVEKFLGILGDTLGYVSIGSPGPLTYNLEERRKSAQFMIERTNEVLGILASNALASNRTRKHALGLRDLVERLDQQVKNELLPLDHEILDRSARGPLTEEFVRAVGEFKQRLDGEVKEAYKFIAILKAAY